MIQLLRSYEHLFERIGLALMLVLLAFVLNQTDWLNRWNLLFYDWNLSHGSRAPAEDIVIVAIDEQSLRKLDSVVMR